jgi:hypothetical protein
MAVMKYLAVTGLTYLAFMFTIAEPNPFAWDAIQRFTLILVVAAASVVTWFCNSNYSL